MKLEIIIPTFHRVEKLLKCLGSIHEARKRIEEEHNLYVYVYFSDKKEYESIDKLLLRYPYIFTRFLEKDYDVGNFWNNHFKDSNSDIFYYLNDDIVLSPDCLKESVKSMILNFSDLDGIIGLNQENIPKKDALPSAFGAIGREYLTRFPEKKVFCPIYKRFYGDREIYEFATKINKFYWEENAKLIHFHPAYNKSWEDETHNLVRKYLNKDRKIYEERHKKSLLWGENFEC